MLCLTEKETLAFSAHVAKQLTPGLVVGLSGELGAGKTTFSRGILRALGFEGTVKSPTYTLVESYPLKDFIVFHLDLYRLAAPEEIYELGVEDFFSKEAVSFIEWPEKANLTEMDLMIFIRVLKEGRQFELNALTDKGRALMESIE